MNRAVQAILSREVKTVAQGERLQDERALVFDTLERCRSEAAAQTSKRGATVRCTFFAYILRLDSVDC